MIQPQKIKVQTVEHFNPEGESLGFLNEFENMDLRCQIAEQSAIGYYLMFNSEKIEIAQNGKINKCPIGLYDVIETSFARLFRAQKTFEKIN